MSRSPLTIRLSDEEREAFEARASELGLSLGAYLRLLGRTDCDMDEEPRREVRVSVPRET